MPIDPVTVAGVGMSVLGSKELLNKLLGPTAEYLGSDLLTFVKRCKENVDAVFRLAIRKTGDKISEPAKANPRVLQQVIAAASFSEDPIVNEYLAGVLASSRTEDGKDDRGVCFLNDIQSLSNYQLRTHYLVYSAIARFGPPANTNLHSWYGMRSHETVTLVFTDDSYQAAMDCQTAFQKQSIGTHSFLGLEARQLLRGGVTAFQEWDDQVGRVGEPWRFCWPTRYGHELFAWGLGLGEVRLTSYFDVSAELVTDLLPPLKVTRLELGEMSITADVRDYESETVYEPGRRFRAEHGSPTNQPSSMQSSH